MSMNPDANAPGHYEVGGAPAPSIPFEPELRPYTRAWVMALPLREQGTLMAGIRGCDTVVDAFVPTHSNIDGVVTVNGWKQVRHPTKAIVACLRYTVGTPHDPREVDTAGAFMASELPDVNNWPTKCLDDLPLHFVMHFMHAIEVIAYRGPRESFGKWLTLYYRICDHMHVKPESRAQMIERLSEDRIALGTVKPVERRVTPARYHSEPEHP